MCAYYEASRRQSVQRDFKIAKQQIAQSKYDHTHHDHDFPRFGSKRGTGRKGYTPAAAKSNGGGKSLTRTASGGGDGGLPVESSAEHLVATKALRCTASAWNLIVAQCIP